MTQLHDEAPTILDVTRLEQDARRLRAAYIKAGIRKGWARLVAQFHTAQHANDHGTSKA
ncbi:RSP_7527 family protein [Roseinatronobacter sp. S2]|uniref:RSP_7527 family protein n=1 Tax=Roseinatronobacter sp. S2 TaxID=3035471 RepID=UPI00240F6C7B|nr:hypothetical protein [Roseinatronobacter sp. S2]WFE73188.1 hypothetical protein P8S53_08280 [Roseinatronobacter sp. S2]